MQTGIHATTDGTGRRLGLHARLMSRRRAWLHTDSIRADMEAPEGIERAVVGIDPGVSGAVGALLLEHDMIWRPWVWDLPYTHDYVSAKVASVFDIRSFIAILSYLKQACLGEIVVGIEEQGGRPYQNLPSTVKNIGTAKLIEGICHVMATRVYLVRASVWKGHFALDLGAKVSRKDRKEAAREMAQKRFPSVILDRVKDEGRAEALLIAQYMYECGY